MIGDADLFNKRLNKKDSNFLMFENIDNSIADARRSVEKKLEEQELERRLKETQLL